jgi:glycine/D-amino acid oxidase-like deaminating enzyme/nitrite reductase/ring-hydroxylating ferredoxin subunit
VVVNSTQLRRRKIFTTSATSSLWLAGAAGEFHPPLDRALKVDVAVVGGGIAGVTTALRLQRAGARVALLEAASLGSGVTGNTSAKVSALQATMLGRIASHHGEETAQIYAAASLAAVDDVALWAAREQIDCDLHHRPAVTYAAGEDDLEEVSAEFEAATRAGLPVRWHDDDAGLPFPVAGAIWLRDQIGFHPVKYVRGLARTFTAAGGQIFEHSRVFSVRDGSPCRVQTDDGTVSAAQVVIATHFPILDRGLFFARMKTQRSYCVAAAVNGDLPTTMAISAGDQTRSTQFTGRTVIIGGEGHSAGASGVTAERFGALESFARSHWPIDRLVGRWSAQDPVPYDHLPMIGPLVPRSKTLWVATGWAKWGLTGGTFAARILSDAILGGEHEWASTFTPSRLSLRGTPEIAALGGKFTGLMLLDRVSPAEVSDPDEIQPDQGRVVRRGAGKVGVYRDDAGELHAVSLRCTHLGCLLRFNQAERSWDCPCHGSRFDVDGDVLEGPAVRALDRLDL